MESFIRDVRYRVIEKAEGMGMPSNFRVNVSLKAHKLSFIFLWDGKVQHHEKFIIDRKFLEICLQNIDRGPLIFSIVDRAVQSIKAVQNFAKNIKKQ